MTYMQWRRHFAVSKSRALRHLYRTHGHIPTHAPDPDQWREWTYYSRQANTRKAAA